MGAPPFGFGTARCELLVNVERCATEIAEAAVHAELEADASPRLEHRRRHEHRAPPETEMALPTSKCGHFRPRFERREHAR